MLKTVLLTGAGLLITVSVARAQGPACDCDCESWQKVSQQPGCSMECDPKWQSWSCGPYLQTGLGDLDAETQRYMAEVRQLNVRENVWKPWVMAFKYSGPEIRVELWDELERHKGQDPMADVPAQMAAIEAEQAERDERRNRYDAETLRYKEALEKAGYPQVEVDGLVEIFAPSTEAVRQVYWSSIQQRN